jgi:hypothetical protein
MGVLIPVFPPPPSYECAPTKEFEKPTEEAKQMTVVQPTGAVSNREGTMRRLQARSVKAVQHLELPRPLPGV